MSSTKDDRTTTGPTRTDPPGPTTGRVPLTARQRTLLVVGVLASLLAGAAVLAVGLPADVMVGEDPLSTLTLPAALAVTLTGVCVLGAAVARSAWRVVDIVVAAVLGVAGGLAFVLWNVAVWPGLSGVLPPPVSALFVGVWLLPGVLGGLVVRRPGAAVFTELVAASLSAMIGNEWGFATVWYGLLQGLGAEVVLALFLYRWWRLPVALLAGAGTGLVGGLLDTTVYYPELVPGVQLTYIAFAVLSGVVIAGLGSWALTRALARTGVLAPLASGRDGRRV
ncbi:ECF transporter S component [Jannaschia sp. R86511]|uniref:ECF transporter S component n=1 Tax=Jannaschia sp. R86511 TaxID=3093853 RepID=UPI0036D40E77